MKQKYIKKLFLLSIKMYFNVFNIISYLILYIHYNYKKVYNTFLL